MQPDNTAPLPTVRIWAISAAAVNALAWVLVALAILVRSTVTAFGGFYWDDFTLQGRAARLPLSFDFLVYSHDGHVMPAGALISWLTERAAPLEFWLPTLTMIALQAVVAVASWIVIRRMFGPRPLALLPLLILVFSSMTLPSAVWWAAALNALPIQLAMLAVTWGAWLVQREGRDRAGQIWLLVGLFGGLLFFEKALFVGLWIVLAMWLFADDRRLGAFIRSQWKERRRFWIALLVVGGAYFAFYTVVSDRGATLPTSAGGVVAGLLSAVFVAILPALIGGPVSWQPVGFGSATAHPGPLLVLLAAAAFAGLLWFAKRFSPRGLQAWLAAGIYLGAIVTLMLVTRLAATDPVLGMTSMRYTADALLPLAMAVGMSVMPLVGEKETNELRELRLRAAQRATRTNALAIATVLVSAYFAVVSVSSFLAIWTAIPAKPWLENARTSMAAGAGDGDILDQQIPEYVLWGLAYPYSNASWALAPLPERPAFGSFTNNPRYLTNAGRLVPGEIVGIKSLPGSVGGCGWQVAGSNSSITMEAAAFEWEHRLQLEYVAARAVNTSVRLGSGKVVPVTFEPGRHRMVATVEGGGPIVTIGEVPPDAGLCVSQAVVGTWDRQNPFGR